jgi:TP901 family phage tail tape measure protein
MAEEQETLVIGIKADTSDVDEKLKDVSRSSQELAKKLGLSVDKQGRWRDASGKMLSAAEKARRGLKDFGEQAERTSRDIGKSTLAIEKSSEAFSDMAKKAAAAVGGYVAFDSIKRGVSASVAAFSDFQQSLNSVGAITGLSAAEIDKLGVSADLLGQKMNVLPAAINAAIAAVGSQLPQLLGTPDILLDVTENVLILQKAAKATGDEISALDAAKIVGASLNQFGEDADQAARYINILAAGTKAGASGILRTAGALKNAGTILASSNATFEETNALIQLLSTNALVGENAGTALAAFSTALVNNGDKIKKYVFDANQLNPALVGMEQAIKNLASAQLSSTAITDIFGETGRTAASIIMKNVGSYQELTRQVTGTNEAFSQAETLNKNLSEQFNEIDVSVNRLAITIGEGLAPATALAASSFSNFVNRMNEDLKYIQDNREVTGELTQKFLELNEKVKDASFLWRGFTGFLSLGADAMQAVEDAIMGSTQAERDQYEANRKAAAERAEQAKKEKQQIDERATQLRGLTKSKEESERLISAIQDKERETRKKLALAELKDRIETDKKTYQELERNLAEYSRNLERQINKNKQAQLSAEQELRDAEREATRETFAAGGLGDKFALSDVRREIDELILKSKEFSLSGDTESLDNNSQRIRALLQEEGIGASERADKLREIIQLEQQARDIEIQRTTKSRDVVASELDTELAKLNALQAALSNIEGQETTIKLTLDADAATFEIEGLQERLAAINSQIAQIKASSGGSLPGFRSGGIVGFTGAAMLHGTPNAPEAVLNARAVSSIGADVINEWNRGRFVIPEAIASSNPGNAASNLAPLVINVNGKDSPDGLYYQIKRKREIEEWLKH